MKTLTSLLIGCSLTLASMAMAQQPAEQASPKPQGAEKGKGHNEQAKPVHEAKPRGPGFEEHGANHGPNSPKLQKTEEAPKTPGMIPQQQGEKRGPGTGKVEKAGVKPKAEAAGEPSATPIPEGKKQAEEHRKGMNPPAAAAKASATPATAANAPAPMAPAAPSTSPHVQGVANEQPKELASKIAAAKKPAPAQLQQIKAEHANFHAQPKPERAPAVTFNANYRIEGSDRWQGRQYEAFRAYRPERHDEHWYRSRYTRIELIGGGYYYENNGYWYPAWGYRPSAEYYAYDGPIYVGRRAEPPDQVIADVQSALQQTGYYKGEVDGLLGPLTREALTSYQDDQGLPSTAAIDEPTLDALGMGS